MLHHEAGKLLIGLGLCALACSAAQGSGASAPEASASGAAAPAPFEAELRASPPSTAAPSTAAPSTATPSTATPSTPAAPGAAVAPTAAGAPPPGAASAPPPGAVAPLQSGPAAAGGTPSAPGVESQPGAAPGVASAPLQCVVPPDPELDKESSWSREVGQRLERELAKLQRCSAELTAEEQLTLRLVYAKDGAPASQHVVASTPGACAASECLKQALAGVRSPKLLIDRASIDVSLALAPDRAPQRRSDPVDPLAPEPAPENEGCVDPEVARLSRLAVREVVATAYPDLKQCYGRGLERDHALAGRVDFEFVIAQDGTVSDAWARDATLPDCDAIRCMLSEFRELRFPEPVGRSVRVQYPINYVLEQSPVTLR